METRREVETADRLARKNAFDGSLVCGTRAFNLDTGRDKHLARQEAIKQAFIDPETRTVRATLSQARPECPACQRTNRRLLFEKNGFHYHRCACGMVYVDPIVRPEVLDAYYVGEESYAEVLQSGPQVRLDRLKYGYGLDLIESHRPNRGDLLDIGCGPGLLLEEARARGWRVCGVELNVRFVEHLRRQGIAVVTKPFPSSSIPLARYDAVTAWAVLEHTAKPVAFVRHMREALRPGGVILIDVPNVDALVNRLLHEKAGTFAGWAHINMFNAQTLSTMVEAAGFEVCECETIVTELGTIHNHLAFEDPYFGNGKPVVDLLTPEYLHERLLGGQLLLLARRPAP